MSAGLSADPAGFRGRPSQRVRGAFSGPDGTAADQGRIAHAREALRAFVASEGQPALDVALQTYAGSDPSSRDRLHRLIERQHFRLAWWRTASDEVNWRRFFDIGSLAAVRVERPEVFEDVHDLVFRLYAQRVIDGLRIDHVDGLAEPRAYCERLRQRLTELRDEPPYIVVEKILARGETLRGDWPVEGTTGYDFMNDVGALLHDPAGAAPLAATWAALTGRNTSFADEALDARRKVLAENLAAELERTARALHRIARDAPTTRDFTLVSIRRVLGELVAQFPVYRIYPHLGVRGAADNVYFDQAREAAKRVLPRADHEVLAHIDEWLGAPVPGDAAAAEQEADAARVNYGSHPAHGADAVFATERTGRREGESRTPPVTAMAACCRATKWVRTRANSR